LQVLIEHGAIDESLSNPSEIPELYKARISYFSDHPDMLTYKIFYDIAYRDGCVDLEFISKVSDHLGPFLEDIIKSNNIWLLRGVLMFHSPPHPNAELVSSINKDMLEVLIEKWIANK
jgi:hypothetical protein